MRYGPAGGIQRVPLLEEIIASDSLYAVFQRVVSLSDPDRPVAGYEALARYAEAMPLSSPELLFEYASRKRMATDLDLACVERALRYGNALPEGKLRFINIHPLTLEEGTRLIRLVSQQPQRPPGTLVFELTEHLSFQDVERAAAHSDELRRFGCHFAFDDVGSGFSHLKLLDRIRPEYIKLANEFGTDFETSTFKRKIIEHQVALAHDFDAKVILEGIETQSTADAASAMGIELGQGWHFGRPEPIGSIIGA